MKVYIFNKLEKINIDDYKNVISILPTNIKEKIVNAYNENQALQTLVGYLMLVKGIEDLTGKLSLPRICYEGKPYIAENNSVKYNISHCSNGVILCVGDEEVGVDIESIREYDDSLAKYVSNNEEYNYISSSKDKRIAFISLWTKKESYLKYKGTGINCHLDKLVINNVDIDTVVNTEYNYIYSICRSEKK